MKNQPIVAVLETKVIPLLMEYFSGKTDIVARLFTHTNWRVEYNKTNYRWDIMPKAE
jgi:5-methylcytosine-specific restriction protein B